MGRVSVVLPGPSALLLACPGATTVEPTQSSVCTGLKEAAALFLIYWISQGTRAHRSEAPQGPPVLSQGFLGQGRARAAFQHPGVQRVRPAAHKYHHINTAG